VPRHRYPSSSLLSPCPLLYGCASADRYPCALSAGERLLLEDFLAPTMAKHSRWLDVNRSRTKTRKSGESYNTKREVTASNAQSNKAVLLLQKHYERPSSEPMRLGAALLTAGIVSTLTDKEDESDSLDAAPVVAAARPAGRSSTGLSGTPHAPPRACRPSCLSAGACSCSPDASRPGERASRYRRRKPSTAARAF